MVWAVPVTFTATGVRRYFSLDAYLALSADDLSHTIVGAPRAVPLSEIVENLTAHLASEVPQ